MTIVDFFECENKNYWLDKISECDWRSGKYLYELLRSDQLCVKLGLNAKVLMLIDNNDLLAFCTLSQKKYDIDTVLSPWIGFVYTYPKYRGHRYSEELINYAEELARESGSSEVFVSTKYKELYEKYGFTYYGVMTDWRNEEQIVYYKPIAELKLMTDNYLEE